MKLFNPNKAYLSPKELVSLKRALGRAVAVHVNLYPPGDMYLCAGEILALDHVEACLLYTSPSPRDRQKSRMPSSA